MPGKRQFGLIIDLNGLKATDETRAKIYQRSLRPARELYLPNRHSTGDTAGCHRYQSPFFTR
jgi:hypothetical protein